MTGHSTTHSLSDRKGRRDIEALMTHENSITIQSYEDHTATDSTKIILQRTAQGSYCSGQHKDHTATHQQADGQASQLHALCVGIGSTTQRTFSAFASS